MAGDRRAVRRAAGIRRGSACEPSLLPQMTGKHACEMRIALGGEHGDGMTDGPDADAGNPQLQPDPQCCGDRPVQNGHRSRGTPEENRLGERAVQRNIESFDQPRAHDTSAPPPKEKNDRKKLDAAKAIEIPNTIWMSLRKPPELSPKASVRPVMTMMMTAMILATGPWTESRMDCSGCSQGMFEPAANA